jgi:hypothetical protein
VQGVTVGPVGQDAGSQRLPELGGHDGQGAYRILGETRSPEPRGQFVVRYEPAVPQEQHAEQGLRLGREVRQVRVAPADPHRAEQPVAQSGRGHVPQHRAEGAGHEEVRADAPGVGVRGEQAVHGFDER